MLDNIDLVLVMTVNPGFGGQAFLSFSSARCGGDPQDDRRSAIHLEVDGGIDAETVPLVVEAGANAIVAGNGVFKGGAYKENIAAIRRGFARPRRRGLINHHHELVQHLALRPTAMAEAIEKDVDARHKAGHDNFG